MAAPENEKTDRASKVENPGPAAPATKPAAGKQPGRRAASLLSRALFSAIALLVVLGVAGYGALIFRDSDPNVRVAADYVDSGLKEARGLYAKMQALVAGMPAETAPPEAARGAHALLEKTPLDAPAPETTAAATPTGESGKSPEPVVAPAPPPADAPEVPTQSAQATTATTETKPAGAKPGEPPAIEGKVIEAAPAPVPAPLPAPAPAPATSTAPAAAAKGVDADGFSDRDLISALEGRIDALGDEVMRLRERLDAPKNETRAAPDAEAPKPAPTTAADASGAAVVLAFALQRELEAGRPFADEIAAFSRLAVEPAPAPVLIEAAEKGAPTGAQLREMFAPLARKLEAQESHGADSGALAEHILQGASKLVKVRPTGESEPESFVGKLKRIEAALTHNDFAAAERLYESLPEAARTETSDFGAALRLRVEAARAADDLLHGAIAALGKK